MDKPLPGVHQLRTQDDTSLFLVLLVELQIEIQYNTMSQFPSIQHDIKINNA